MANNLGTLIGAIPMAHDGDVISKEYHNSLGAAVRAIGERLGPSPVTDQTITLVFAPHLAPGGPKAPAWDHAYGYAQKAEEATQADGWMQLQLPDGTRIQSFTVIGRKSGDVGKVRVTLALQGLNGSDTKEYAAIQVDQLAKAGGNFTQTVTPVDAIVDNQQYKVLVTALIGDASNVATVQLFAFQVVCVPV